MFLFHWCLNAIRCRREWTVETTPLSPTKYNGLPPSLDCQLQRQLVDNIPASSYDVTFFTRSLLDDQDTAVQHPTFFQDHRTCVDPENSAASGTCQSRDVMAASYFRPDDVDEPTTLWSSTLSGDDVAATGMNGRCGCECETAAIVNENTTQSPYSFDHSSKSFSSVTQFCIPSSPYFSEIQHGVHSLDKKSFPPLAMNNDLPYDTQSTDDIDSSSRNSLRSTDVYSSEMSHRNVSSFPIDTIQDPLVTVAMLLVNSAVRTAVRILDTDATLTSENNPVDEIVLSPISNTADTIHQPLHFSDESSKDPIEVAASKLVSQVLLEIERKNISSEFACVETLPSKTSITTAVCSASSHSSSSTSSGCESDSKLTADNDVESCIAADADSVLMPAAAEDYLSESSATVCSSVDESEVLTEQERHVDAPKCNYNSVYAVKDDFESTTLLSSGRLAFDSEGWSSASSPFTDAYSPDNISEVMYIDSVNAQELKVDSRMCVSDEPKLYNYPIHIDDDAQTRMMCSAERDLDLSGNTNADDVTNTSILYGMSDDDGHLDVHTRTPLKQYASDNTVTETWNSCQSNYRPEDYFFHRYVIPVDQLEAGDLAEQSERDEQRTKMQLDLKADERKYATDIDADIEAVAAFCRAMFTPVESELHDDDDNILPFDMVGSPETPDTEEQYALGRPAGVRRCISLRTSPGTPHKKKSVRFADALGLDLEYVRQIQTGDDSLPLFASNDDAGCSRRPLLAEASAAWSRSRWPVRRYLCSCFQEPGNHPDFMERVLRSRVVLETCEADDRALRITGVIRVANVAYHKTVAARVTTDGWATQTDVNAEYVPRSNDGTTDRFSFQIVLPHGATDVGRRVEFAVYFIAFFDFDSRSETYWDNNFGANYCFECYGQDGGENSTLDSDNDDDPFSAWFSFT